LITLSRRAETQVNTLIEHCERLDRLNAARNLLAAIEAARDTIVKSSEAGLPAPRPYAQLRKSGRLWVHVRSYWICYMQAAPTVIVEIFHESADIPGRL
jgi:plasmid stabilization system protein ParE